MHKLMIVGVALVVVLGLPLKGARTDVGAMAGMGRSAHTSCTMDCSSTPPNGACLSMCIAAVAVLGGFALMRHSLSATRLGSRSTHFVEQVTGSSLFRPPRFA